MSASKHFLSWKWCHANKLISLQNMASLESHISTRLPRILMKPLISTKFGTINRSVAIGFCSYGKYENFNTLRDIAGPGVSPGYYRSSGAHASFRENMVDTPN